MFFPRPPPEKDYYKILGVDKTASEIEIKSAFRKLSLAYHPDRNKTEGAQAKFQEIGEAYETLSDPQKKHEYDQSVQGANPFQTFFGGQSAAGFPTNVRIFHSSGGESNFPSGFGIDDIFQQLHRHSMKPAPIQKQLSISIEQAYHGCNLPMSIERSVLRNNEQTKESETIYIPVPEGIDHNETIVIPERGHLVNDTHRGDIRVTIQVTNSTAFVRNGLDLIYKKTISLKEALLGTSFQFVHISGKPMHIQTQTPHIIIRPNHKQLFPHLGMIRENKKGNLWIEFDVAFPDSFKEEQLKILSDIL
jgi:curved DNA-binding protein